MFNLLFAPLLRHSLQASFLQKFLQVYQGEVLKYFGMRLWWDGVLKNAGLAFVSSQGPGTRAFIHSDKNLAHLVPFLGVVYAGGLAILLVQEDVHFLA